MRHGHAPRPDCAWRHGGVRRRWRWSRRRFVLRRRGARTRWPRRLPPWRRSPRPRIPCLHRARTASRRSLGGRTPGASHAWPRDRRAPGRDKAGHAAAAFHEAEIPVGELPGANAQAPGTSRMRSVPLECGPRANGGAPPGDGGGRNGAAVRSAARVLRRLFQGSWLGTGIHSPGVRPKHTGRRTPPSWRAPPATLAWSEPDGRFLAAGAARTGRLVACSGGNGHPLVAGRRVCLACTRSARRAGEVRRPPRLPDRASFLWAQPWLSGIRPLQPISEGTDPMLVRAACAVVLAIANMSMLRVVSVPASGRLTAPGQSCMPPSGSPKGPLVPCRWSSAACMSAISMGPACWREASRNAATGALLIGSGGDLWRRLAACVPQVQYVRGKKAAPKHRLTAADSG